MKKQFDNWISFFQELQGYESIRMTFVKFASENNELAGENISSFQ